MKIKKEYILAVISIVLGVIIFILASQFPDVGRPDEPGPAFFPQLIAIFFLISGGLFIYRGRSSNDFVSFKVKDIESGRGLFNLISVLILIGLYIYFFDILGFIESSFLFLIIVLSILDVGKLKSILVSAIVVFVMYYIFSELFLVPFPSGIIF